MLTPEALNEHLNRLRQLTQRDVGEAAASIQSEQLALAPWHGLEDAIEVAVLHAVAFANRHGGELVFGIEEDGRITGCDVDKPQELPAAIFARTRPGIVVDCWTHPTDEGVLIVLSIPEGMSPHATSEGLRIRREGRANLPITPDQDGDILAMKGEMDFSDRPVPGLSTRDLDPMQILYLREILRRKNDQSDLLELTDGELLDTLGLIADSGVPKVAALILLGSRAVLRERLPQAEVVYIHYDEHEEPDVQEQLYLPMLHTLSRVQDLIEARNRFTTLKQGLFHFQIKDLDEDVYREALVNALVHRDYSRRDGSVHVTHHSDRLEIANPGGLIGGIRVDNILYHPPRHRNRRLTEVLQQLGLMERAGMGVNRLYRFLLRRGKEAPDYQVSSGSVLLTIQCGNFDEKFAAFVYEEESRGRLFGLDMLMVLSSLKRLTVLDRATAAQRSQRPDRVIGNTLSKMVELGYIERIGRGRATAYRLTSWVYEQLGSSVAYFRDRGLSRRRQLALILEVMEELGSLNQEECEELCGVGPTEAVRLLAELRSEDKIQKVSGRFELTAVMKADMDPDETT